MWLRRRAASRRRARDHSGPRPGTPYAARSRSFALAPTRGRDWQRMAEKRGDAALILTLARGATVRDAAREANLSERSAYRRVADPAFRQQLSRARCDLLWQAIGLLAQQAADAARTLAGLLTADSDSIKLRAAV